MLDVMASLWEFSCKVVRRWYAVGVGVIGGVLGLVSGLHAQAHPKAAPLVPMSIWLTLLAGGFLVAIIWAFHDVRRERDAAKGEMESRFDALRYALGISEIGSHAQLRPDRVTADIEINFDLANNSAEYLRYEFECMTVIIQARQSAADDPSLAGGTIIAPGRATHVICPSLEGVPVVWQTGSLSFTVRYGHPSAPPRYRKSQTYRLRTMRMVGQPEGQAHIVAELESDPEVEEIQVV